MSTTDDLTLVSKNDPFWWFDPGWPLAKVITIPGPGRDPAQKPLKIWAVWAVFLDKRSKSCFEMSGLSGFWTDYLKKPLKNRSKQDFERNCLKKPLKPLKSCFKLGKKSRLGGSANSPIKTLSVGMEPNFIVLDLLDKT